MENKVHIIEGKTYLNRAKLNPLLVAMVGELAKADYRETNTFLDALWGVALESPVRIVRGGTRGTRVYINTPNKKRLARAVFDEIRNYLGEPQNKPANTNVEALIIERGNEWVQNQPDADILNPQDYAAYVFGATDEALAKMNLDEAEHNAVFDAVQSWYEKQSQSPTAQPLNNEQPADPVPTMPKKRKRNISPVVNADGLKKYFTMEFQNKGLFNYLVSDIVDLRTAKDCATVARMVYDMVNGAGFINSFPTFAAWCRVFFENIGVTVSKNYNFSKRTPPTDKLKRKFYYLE